MTSNFILLQKSYTPIFIEHKENGIIRRRFLFCLMLNNTRSQMTVEHSKTLSKKKTIFLVRFFFLLLGNGFDCYIDDVSYNKGNEMNVYVNWILLVLVVCTFGYVQIHFL